MPSVKPSVPAALGMRFTYQSIARPGTRLQAARALENLRGALNVTSGVAAED